MPEEVVLPFPVTREAIEEVAMKHGLSAASKAVDQYVRCAEIFTREQERRNIELQSEIDGALSQSIFLQQRIDDLSRRISHAVRSDGVPGA
ncbi:hypothetical protein [Streptomyces sp. NPDC127084]|uniref:hypothetical protein n=1 Tax=Streptomyces sp. NPDC127084 TaxID=3347133 RepID=UPI0036515B82